MNTRKGFTLVEILVVIVIIAALFAIAVPSIMGISKKMKERGFEAKIESIEQAAVNFAQDNANKIKDKYGKGYIKDGKYTFKITVRDLINYDAYKSEKNDSNTTCDVTNPMDKNSCLDCREIEITLDDEYKTVKAQVLRPEENNKYLIGSTTCPPEFSMEREYKSYTVNNGSRDWIGYKGEKDEVLEIPETFERNGVWYKVTGIGHQAFYGCNKLVKIVLPKSVRSISTEAFYDCDSLIEFDIDGDSDYLEVHDGILFTKNLKTIVRYPPSKEGINYNVPEGTISVGSAAFEGCKYLKEVILPETIKSIQQSAFAFNNSIQKVVIQGELTSMGSEAFRWCSNLEEINLPEGLQSIPSSAFAGDSKLKDIVIPSTVKSIGCQAFFMCTSLTKINIPGNTTYISWLAFDFCPGIKEIIFEDGTPNILTISKEAFTSFSSLKYIRLSNTIKYIDDDAFTAARSLEKVTYDNNDYYNQKDLMNAINSKGSITLNTPFLNTGLPKE